MRRRCIGSLQALAALPEATLVCCGHEYTESNARFALTVEPDNAALRARAAEVKAQRAAGQFDGADHHGAGEGRQPLHPRRDVARLAEIRTAKDNFR